MAIQPIRWPALKDWRDVLVRTWKEAGADVPLPIQADGDPVGTLPASISLHEDALSLC